jgi:glycerol-3-phosphate O-acyltransferase
MDDICQAVLARDEVVRYLNEPHGEDPGEARRRVQAFLTELRTRQRYPLYKSLKYAAFPLILWRIRSIGEHADIAQAASAAGRVIYASNHKSHTDYVVQPVLLDNYGIRAPIIAAGINLFGGPLGLLHRHVTGAIPIRRATKDPAYLITLKAYIAELLRHHDLLFYIEGGRSYSGELKPPKTGLIHAAMQARTPGLVIVPMAISYDLVLEDRVLARQGVKKRQRPFTQEIVEMMRNAIGFYTRAFVTFGDPIPTDIYDPASRTDVLTLANRTREVIGRLYKVTPTAVVAASMLPSLERAELEDRADHLLDELRKAGANLGVESGAQAVASAIRPMQKRGILVHESGRYRVRNRLLLRYYARTLDHLLQNEPQAR